MAEFDGVNLDFPTIESSELADLISAVESSEMEVQPPVHNPEQNVSDSDALLAEIFPDLFTNMPVDSFTGSEMYQTNYSSFNTAEQFTGSNEPNVVVQNNDSSGQMIFTYEPVQEQTVVSVVPEVNIDIPAKKTRTTSRSSDEGIGMSPVNTLGSPPSQSLTNETAMASPDFKSTLVSPKEEDPDDTNCKVCLEKAGKHSYYGGRVCPSCRAFFRRAVQSKYYEIFFCTKGENCEINLKTRRSCQYCRFKKCLESGMRISWVLPEAERNRRFNKLAKVQQRNKFGDQKNSRAVVPIKKDPVMPVTTEEILQIQKTKNCINTFSCRGMEEFMVTHPEFLKELATVSYFGGEMSFEFYKNFNNMSNKILEESFRIVEEFKELPWKDRQRLIEHNGVNINRFKTALFMDDDFSCLSKGIEGFTKSGQYPVLDELNAKLQAMNLQDKKPILSYSQLHGNVWQRAEDEQRHLELLRKMRAWPRDSENSAIDDVQVTLMRMIMAFDTDSVKLERPDLVMKAQLRFAFLLQRYLKSKYGLNEANKRFGNGIMMTAYAREAAEILDKSMNQKMRYEGHWSANITEIPVAQH